MIIKLMNNAFLTAIIGGFILLLPTPAMCQDQGQVQGKETANPVLTVGYDPIVTMLDSLVNQKFIQKLSFVAQANQQNNPYQPYEIPNFNEEIYKSRIAKIQSPMPLCYNQQVRDYIDLYALKRRSTMERVMGLANLYFPLFEQTLDQQGLPDEFKYLAIVESALNPVAVSPVGATGLWQFMLATGKMYNLKVNSYIDERRDPEKATFAACQYFKDMYAIYKDWLLVIASYNCGPGNVNKAIARSGGKKTFWEICQFLPKETRGYVPAFIAVTYLMNYQTEHNLTAIAPVINYYEADTVLIDQKISLKEISDKLNTSEDLLAYLNPVYKKRIIPVGDESYVLRLPSNKVNTFIANMDNIFKPQHTELEDVLSASNDNKNDNVNFVSKTIRKQHKVKRGENIYSIANNYDCSASQIKKWNRLKSVKLYAGQRLNVYVSVKQRVNQQQAETASAKLKIGAKKVNDKKADSTHALIDSAKHLHNDSLITDSANANKQLTQTQNEAAKIYYYTVQRGDTLWNIAQRYAGVTVKDLKMVNNINGNALKVGTKLKVVVKG